MTKGNDASLYYMRGLLKFCEHNFYEGLTDMDKAIDKVDDPKAEYFLARGRCYACLSMFKEAILDLTNAINLNKNLMDAYLNRGKCAYLIGDTGLAFMDFQKLILLEPKNPIVHIYAGNLLMTTGSYEDATKAFSNAWNIHRTPLALYQRARVSERVMMMLVLRSSDQHRRSAQRPAQSDRVLSRRQSGPRRSGVPAGPQNG